ncbi:ABC transporter permease [Nitrospirillum viridazoti]|uniref:ABC transporter permease n=1 Tax=Nitrospirillum viridazoti CBAmc TaxID=1441467 RepID=A0A248JQ35_9PROT|nr:ABC transporter permease [Nitrospirillum amazonense]ASG20863.1 ABC transporter permease [Nitrospirillum amazonense CBAmc]TWB37793.1 NitT/TauT family transport system permease protein [Nitrospirillum amazonense]
MSALRRLAPVILGMIVLAAWEGLVRLLAVPAFVLPPPSAVVAALLADPNTLGLSLWFTLTVTLQAFALAVTGGVALAILFTRSPLLASALYPYAVILQVTPVMAIAPLLLVWVGYERVDLAQLILAWIVAFFPILGNTTLGLRSADAGLRDLFRLYGASKWQVLWRLELPSALPYLLAGMKISGGLALIGAVVAEFVAGSGTGSGLAWRIVDASNRLNTPRMFAALALLSLLGIAIFALLSLVQRLALRRWHDSEASHP